MITDNTKWHYLALKSNLTDNGFMKPTQNISRLFTKITSTNTTSDYYCMNCLHTYRKENALKEHELVCEKHDHCEIKMPSQKSNILKYIQGSKSLKMAHTIYVDIECLSVEHNTGVNDPNKLYKTNLYPCALWLFNKCEK